MIKLPNNIEKEAKDYIEDVIKMLEENDLIHNVDSAAITMLAYNYSMFIKASKQLEKEGYTVVSDRNNVSPHPAIKIAKDAQLAATKLMVEFGLTSKSRKKLTPNSKEEESPLEAFIKAN